MRIGKSWWVWALLALLSVANLVNQGRRLLLISWPAGATDLLLRRLEVWKYFSGGELGDYPPATYIILWPLGIVPGTVVRVGYAVLVGAILWLVARGLQEYVKVPAWGGVALLLATSSVALTIGNGQLGLIVVPAAVLALLLTWEDKTSQESTGEGSARWRTGLAGALWLVAMLKPTMSLPFAMLALLRKQSFRGLALGTLVYGLLTLAALQVRSEPWLHVLTAWPIRADSPVQRFGYMNVATWARDAGVPGWAPAFTVGVLLLWMIGAWWYRERPLWLLMGGAGIVARVMSYHSSYDDLLLFVAMIAIWMQARSARMGLLLAAIYAVLLMPAGWMQVPAKPWGFFEATHTLALTVLTVMLVQRLKTPESSMSVR